MIELEFILMYINKKVRLNACFILVHVASLLMLFLRPAEVFVVLEKIVEQSKNSFKAKAQDKLDWYITLDMQSYTQNLCTFVQAYIQTNWRKKRSILVHCQDIRFDFTRFVDSGFKSFMTNYLPLSIMHEFMMVFLLEGQLGFYRYLYSTLRNHKEFIKELNKDKIGQEPRGVSMIDDIMADDQADVLRQVEARAQT